MASGDVSPLSFSEDAEARSPRAPSGAPGPPTTWAEVSLAELDRLAIRVVQNSAPVSGEELGVAGASSDAGSSAAWLLGGDATSAEAGTNPAAGGPSFDPLGFSDVRPERLGGLSRSPRPSPALDPGSAAFDPSLYLAAAHAHRSLPELRRGALRLRGRAEEQRAQLRELVRDNFGGFLTSAELLQEVGSRLRGGSGQGRAGEASGEGAEGRGRGAEEAADETGDGPGGAGGGGARGGGAATAAALAAAERASEASRRLHAPLLDRAERAERIRAVLAALDSHARVVGWSGRVRDAASSGDVEGAAEQYTLAVRALGGAGAGGQGARGPAARDRRGGAWARLRAEVDEAIADTSERLMLSILDVTLDPAECLAALRALRRLRDAGAPRLAGADPIADCLGAHEAHARGLLEAASAALAAARRVAAAALEAARVGDARGAARGTEAGAAAPGAGAAGEGGVESPRPPPPPGGAPSGPAAFRKLAPLRVLAAGASPGGDGNAQGGRDGSRGSVRRSAAAAAAALCRSLGVWAPTFSQVAAGLERVGRSGGSSRDADAGERRAIALLEEIMGGGMGIVRGCVEIFAAIDEKLGGSHGAERPTNRGADGEPHARVPTRLLPTLRDAETRTALARSLGALAAALDPEPGLRSWAGGARELAGDARRAAEGAMAGGAARLARSAARAAHGRHRRAGDAGGSGDDAEATAVDGDGLPTAERLEAALSRCLEGMLALSVPGDATAGTRGDPSPTAADSPVAATWSPNVGRVLRAAFEEAGAEAERLARDGGRGTAPTERDEFPLLRLCAWLADVRGSTLPAVVTDWGGLLLAGGGGGAAWDEGGIWGRGGAAGGARPVEVLFASLSASLARAEASCCAAHVAALRGELSGMLRRLARPGGAEAAAAGDLGPPAGPGARAAAVAARALAAASELVAATEGRGVLRRSALGGPGDLPAVGPAEGAVAGLADGLGEVAAGALLAMQPRAAGPGSVASAGVDLLSALQGVHEAVALVAGGGGWDEGGSPANVAGPSLAEVSVALATRLEAALAASDRDAAEELAEWAGTSTTGGPRPLAAAATRRAVELARGRQ